MRIEKLTEKYFIVFEENFFNGRKKITVNGVESEKMTRFRYFSPVCGVIEVKGNYLYGVTLIIEGEKVEIVKNKWYEWLLIICNFICIIVGGVVTNSLINLMFLILAISMIEVAMLLTLRGKQKKLVKLLMAIFYLLLSITIVVVFGLLSSK